jgi:hypothetical protein
MDAPSSVPEPRRVPADREPAAPARATFAVRCRARLRRAELDRSLAEGADPLTRPELRWRGRQLMSHRQRRRLATEIERVLKAAKSQPWLGGSAAPLNRGEIARCRELLQALASDLQEKEQVGLRGVALTAHLLHDGCSPLYAHHAPATEGELEVEVRRARGALLLRY